MARSSRTRRTLALPPGAVAAWGCLLAVLLWGWLGLPSVVAADTPRLLITEVLPIPRAVNDDDGEWVEIANPGPAAVNLRHWRLLDGYGEQHVIFADVWVPSGGYIVLARNGNLAVNGGVRPAYVYADLDLTNTQGQVILATPDDDPIDAVAWGGDSGLVSHAGASLERTAADPAAPFVVAQTPWPGSAGDLGSPGAPYTPPTPTPVPTAAASITPPPATPPRVFLSEVMIDPAAVPDDQGEWVEVYNADAQPVNLTGWLLTDDDQDHAVLEGDIWIPPGGYAVLARQGDPATNGGVHAAAVYAGLQLANDGDELHLVAAWGVVVDSLSWGHVTAGVSLERTGFTADAAWVPALAPWPGSAGDLGSPGAAYGSPPGAPPTPTATPSPTATVPPTPTPLTPRLLLSEVMIDPAAVPDDQGEWVEVYNDDAVPVNLAGWVLADEDQDRAELADDAWIAPGGYAVLARQDDPAANGGVDAVAVYAGLQLANGGDELLLLTPWGARADRLGWGRVPSGVSLERVPTGGAFGDADLWVPAAAVWPGSAGDRGSPGAPYTPPPAAMPTPTALPPVWPIVTDVSPLRIDEVAYHGADGEFIVLRNTGEVAVDLTGWRLGDAERVPSGRGDGEGLVSLPSLMLPPGGLWVAARDATGFRAVYGRAPDAEWRAADPAVPDLPGVGDLALADDGDEVILLNPAGQVADAIAYGDAAGDAVGLYGVITAPTGDALHLAADAPFPAVTDMRQRAWLAPPTPFTVDTLPGVAALAAVPLDDGLMAYWGSLGSQSTFSPGGRAPPHVLAAIAAGQGLDFLAIADTDHTPHDLAHAPPSSLTLLPAWRWADRAIVYSDALTDEPADTAAWDDLAQYLSAHAAPAQMLTTDVPSDAHLVAFAGDDATAPGALSDLLKVWRRIGAPLLPAGNLTPPLPGVALPAPRYTGLAAHGHSADDLLAALTAHRGWLTSAPGLWLTLRTDRGAWMGATVVADGDITLHIVYGDRSGAAAGLALWQDGEIIRRLDTPPPDGRWTIRVAAHADSYLYAVATQFDGDFAVTAPLLVVGDPDPVEPTPLPPPVDDDEPDPIPVAARGQATGPPGTLTLAKWRGLARTAEFRGQVVVPPGLFNSAIYVAEPALDANSAPLPLAGLGIQVYLNQGDFLPMQEGDWVLVRGEMRSFRGEMEVDLDEPGQAWPIGPGTPLLPLPVSGADIGESLEGRFVTFDGIVTGWRTDSLLLGDPTHPDAPPVRVTIRSSLDWKRPFVNLGDRYRVTGIVSQFATAAPWNDGYRVLVRYESDLIKLSEP